MSRPSDHDLDLSVAAVLRIGVSMAALVVFAGGALHLQRPWSLTPDYSQFHVGDDTLRSLSGIWRGALQMDSRCIILLGLVILIATPVARVVLCIIGFARQRSILYVVISSIVLAILVYSLTMSMR